MITNSLFFNRIDLVKMIFYRYLAIINGSFTLLGLLLFPFEGLCTILLTPLSWSYEYLKGIDLTLSGNIGMTGIIVVFLLHRLFLKRISVKYLLIAVILLNLSIPAMKMSFIDVGHGDAILIQEAFNKRVYLIDTGSSYYVNRLNNYLKANGIDRIDYLITTHNDSDHNGNVSYLLDNYRVKNYIGVKDDASLKDIPFMQLNDGCYETDNDNSMVFMIDINGFKILLTGDISKQVENRLIDDYYLDDIDLVKIAHHGSSTSSSRSFIEEISPAIAVISCSDNYSFPSSEVVEILKDNDIKTMITKDDGDIVLYFTPLFEVLRNANNEFVIIRK